MKKRMMKVLALVTGTLISMSCSNDSEGSLPSVNPDTTIVQTHLAAYDGQSQNAESDTDITDMKAFLFQKGTLTEIYELGASSPDNHKIQIDSRTGNLYVVAYAGGSIPTDDLLSKSLSEENWKSSIVHMNGRHAQFYTGVVALETTSSPNNTATVTLKRGLARFDLTVNTTEVTSVNSVTLKNIARSAYAFPQDGIISPAEANRKDTTVVFTEPITDAQEGIIYAYEQENTNIEISVTALIGGRETTLTKQFDGPLKRNTIYTVTVRQNQIDIQLSTSLEDWENGSNTELIPGLDSRLTIDQTLSQLTEDMQVTDEGSTLIFPHGAAEVLLAVDCDDELEVLPTSGYPVTVEPVAQTRGLEGKNLFRIRKALYAPGMAAEEMTLQFHRKGLDNSYPEDGIRLVLQANPVQIEGLLTFDTETYTHRFDRYIDNELGTFTLPDDKQLSVEFAGNEDSWLKLELREGTDNVYRVLAGWKPNDPTANGRIQEGKLVISNKADGTEREEYLVSRRNYGLPVTWLHGVWWCKYNARGNSRSFDDQVLSSADPAAMTGQTVFQYLETCTAEEYYDLWGWAYQGDSGKGLRVINRDGTAVLDGFATGQTVHMNRLSPTALAPEGYEVPSMEEFNRVFDATDYVWVMWNGTHELKNPWEGHSRIQRTQKRRNDIVVDSLALTDLIYIAMKSPDFPQYEPVVWYGPAAQWNDSGIYHGHYNNILFTVYEPGGKGWYFNGSMAGLYLTQNGAGNNDTRILRFKKSPVEYIYGVEE